MSVARPNHRASIVGVGLSLVLIVLFTVFIAAGAGCEPEDDVRCGPAQATAAFVIDGDTIELDSGERIRYLLVDTPETTRTNECYGTEASLENANLVLGETVELTYDQECTDRFGRLLAYVSVNGIDVSEALIDGGFGCVLHIPPNGADRVDSYRAFETRAENEGRGLWGACTENPCR